MHSDKKKSWFNKSGRKIWKTIVELLFVFCKVMEIGTSELTQNAEFISYGLTQNGSIPDWLYVAQTSIAWLRGFTWLED